VPAWPSRPCRPSGAQEAARIRRQRAPTRPRAVPRSTTACVDARRLGVPVLWVSSENDGYTKCAGETRQLYRAARGHARPDRLLVVRGDDHGIDLLTGAQARRVVPAVTRFIRRG
jgi:hypothetical protein